jgi:GT2 family glycosyltransferase
MLRHTLETLAAQRFPRDEFEVVVADDGSTDTTPAVVRSFETALRLRYHFQEDLGFRAAATRNAGAWLASAPVLVFMDTGTLAGPDFVRTHLAAHQAAHASGPRRAVIGETYGYRPHDPAPGLAEAIVRCAPEEVLRRYRDVPSFQDWRNDELAALDFDLSRRAVPWLMFWSTNISMPAADFAAVGGFDEDFRSWGAEDLELGFKLAQRGLELVYDRNAWAVETPHERDHVANVASNQRNALLFLTKHREPAAEVLWAMFMRDVLWPVEYAYRDLLDWTRQAPRTVHDELARAVRGLPDGTRVAVFGCGDELPADLPEGSVVMDFDRELLDKATAGGQHEGHHAIGLRTPVPPDSVDVVVITSRLSGLWAEWSGELSAEARRIGRGVRGPLLTADR